MHAKEIIGVPPGTAEPAEKNGMKAVKKQNDFWASQKKVHRTSQPTAVHDEPDTVSSKTTIKYLCDDRCCDMIDANGHLEIPSDVTSIKGSFWDDVRTAPRLLTPMLTPTRRALYPCAVSLSFSVV